MDSKSQKRPSQSHTSSDGVTRQFFDAAERLVALMERVGIRVRAFAGTGPRWFSVLEESAKKRHADDLARYVAVCEEVAGGGISLRDDQQMLWKMLQKLGVRPPADLLDWLGEGDVVEVYDAQDWVQIYRNWRFFELCSYTLDDLAGRPWQELYEREPGIHERVAEFAEKACSQKTRTVIPCDVPVHTQVEVDTEAKIRATIQNKAMAPLFDRKGGVAAFVSITSVIEVSSQRTV